MNEAHQCQPETCGGTYYDPCAKPWGTLARVLSALEEWCETFESAVPTPMIQALLDRHSNLPPGAVELAVAQAERQIIAEAILADCEADEPPCYGCWNAARIARNGGTA